MTRGTLKYSLKKKITKAHLSSHDRHLSLKHGFVKAFICLKKEND